VAAIGRHFRFRLGADLHERAQRDVDAGDDDDGGEDERQRPAAAGECVGEARAGDGAGGATDDEDEGDRPIDEAG